MFKYNGVIKQAKPQSNTKKSFLYARKNSVFKYTLVVGENYQFR